MAWRVLRIILLAIFQSCRAARIDLASVLAEDDRALHEPPSKLISASISEHAHRESRSALMAAKSNSSGASRHHESNTVAKVRDESANASSRPIMSMEANGSNRSSHSAKKNLLLQIQMASSAFVGLEQAGFSFKMSFWLLLALLCICLICSCFCCGEMPTKVPTKFEALDERQQVMIEGRLLYEWEQTDTTVSLYTRWPSDVSKRDLDVFIGPKLVAVKRKDKQPPAVKGELYATVDAKESTCSMNRRGEMTILLVKIEESEWPYVFLEHQSNT